LSVYRLAAWVFSNNMMSTIFVSNYGNLSVVSTIIVLTSQVSTIFVLTSEVSTIFVFTSEVSTIFVLTSEVSTILVLTSEVSTIIVLTSEVSTIIVLTYQVSTIIVLTSEVDIMNREFISFVNHFMDSVHTSQGTRIVMTQSPVTHMWSLTLWWLNPQWLT